MSNISDDDLRLTFIQQPERIAKLKLSAKQRQIYRQCQKGLTTTIDIAKHFNLSLETTNYHLRLMYKAGYLNRGAIVHSSGGLMYEYTDAMPC